MNEDIGRFLRLQAQRLMRVIDGMLPATRTAPIAQLIELASDLVIKAHELDGKGPVLALNASTPRNICRDDSLAMFDPVAPDAHQLARRVKAWHALQGDPLPLTRCQHLVAVVQGHASWPALQRAAQTVGELGAGRLEAASLEVGRLKQFGYTTEAAQKLIAYLTTTETP